jgi:peptide/nickel transport system substrate-binding protein
MRTRTSRLAVIMLVVMLGSTIAACVAPAPQVVEKQVVVTATPGPQAAAKNPFTPADETVVVAHNQDGFNVLDLRQGYPDASAYFVQLQILEGLILEDDKLQIRDALADKWEANADSTEYTFHLKQGVKFQDGDPFNAAAVKAHFDFFLADPPSPVAATLRPDIAKVDVVDDSTVKFTLKGPRPFFLQNLAESPAGLIYSPKTIARPAADRLRNIAGTGPFQIKEWLGQRDLMLVANPDYNWPSSYFTNKGPSKIKNLHIRNAADTDSRLASLETGESNFVTLVPEAQVARLKKDPNFDIVGKLVPGMPQMNYINVKIPPTDNLLVRQAINYATNKDEINQLVYYGLDEPAYGPLSKANLEFNPVVKDSYPYSPTKAIELLKQAGWWDDNKDGIAEAHNVKGVKDEAPLEVNIVRGRSWQQYSDVWQAQLATVGFKAKVLMVVGANQNDWAGCVNQLPANGDVFADSLVGMTRDWSKDQCTGGAMNYSCSCDTTLQPPIDAALDKAVKATTVDERKAALGELQKYVMDQALEVPIYELYWFAGMTSSLKGVKTDGTGFYYYFYDAYWQR